MLFGSDSEDSSDEDGEEGEKRAKKSQSGSAALSGDEVEDGISIAGKKSKSKDDELLNNIFGESDEEGDKEVRDCLLLHYTAAETLSPSLGC